MKNILLVRNLNSFIILLLLLSFQLHAQDTYRIEGIVLDENEMALPGANVFLPEIEKGGISDIDGIFTISILSLLVFKGKQGQIEDVRIAHATVRGVLFGQLHYGDTSSSKNGRKSSDEKVLMETL